MNDKNKVIVPVVLVVCFGCVLACMAMLCITTTGLLVTRYMKTNDQASGNEEWVSVEEGDEAPDFELETLTGDRVQLSELRGGPVVLSFGASWCPPCREEVGILQDLHETYPELFVLLVDIGEGYWDVQDFAAEYELTYTIALDEDETVAIDYGIYAIPAIFFIDEAGQVQANSVGAPTHSEMKEYLERIGIESAGW